MLLGIEYVIAAYGIWIGTFVVYILIIKRRMRITGKAVKEIKQRFSEYSTNSEKTVSIENQN